MTMDWTEGLLVDDGGGVCGVVLGRVVLLWGMNRRRQLWSRW